MIRFNVKALTADTMNIGMPAVSYRQWMRDEIELVWRPRTGPGRTRSLRD